MNTGNRNNPRDNQMNYSLIDRFVAHPWSIDNCYAVIGCIGLVSLLIFIAFDSANSL